MLQIVNEYPNGEELPGLFRARHVRGVVRTDAPRVLAILNMGTGWSRGVLRGFMASAHERGWTVLHYPPPVDLARLVQKFAPAAVVIGPDSGRVSDASLSRLSLVSVALDLSSDGIASVCPDEESVGALALEHLLATGLRQVSTFRLDGSQFGVARARGPSSRVRVRRVPRSL